MYRQLRFPIYVSKVKYYKLLNSELENNNIGYVTTPKSNNTAPISTYNCFFEIVYDKLLDSRFKNSLNGRDSSFKSNNTKLISTESNLKHVTKH